MGKSLVAYFSASGVTKKLAGALAEAAYAELYEIKPAVPYTKEDLDWTNKSSRSSLEMNDPASRPAISDKSINVEAFDVIYVGFPIWWSTAPTIVNTFLESHDFAGKTIILFATSAGSDIGQTAEKLAGSCSGAAIKGGKVLSGAATKEELQIWIESLDL